MALLGGPADLVLSDMAPNTTGHAATDHIRIMALAELALDFAMQRPGAGRRFVAKVFQGGSEQHDAGADEAAFRHRPPRQAAGQPQGIERAVCGGHGVSRRVCAEQLPRHATVLATLRRRRLCGRAKVAERSGHGTPR